MLNTENANFRCWFIRNVLCNKISAESSAFYTAVQKFQTTLGRQV